MLDSLVYEISNLHKFICIKLRINEVTVNSENFAKVFIFANAKFLEKKRSRNGQITQSSTIDLNEVDMRIYLPEKVIFIEAAQPR